MCTLHKLINHVQKEESVFNQGRKFIKTWRLIEEPLQDEFSIHKTFYDKMEVYKKCTSKAKNITHT